MKVAKWGNSLAVRLPVAVVQSLQLKEGDDVQIRQSGSQILAIARGEPKRTAYERLRKFQVDFPDDFKFDRDEANAR